MTINKALLALALGFAIAACSNNPSGEVTVLSPEERASALLTKLEVDTKSCIDISKNKNSTPISIMSVCQLAYTQYSTLSMSTVAETMYYLKNESDKEKFLTLLREIEDTIIKSKTLEQDFTGNRYVENVLREQKLAADVIRSDDRAVKEASEASRKMD